MKITSIDTIPIRVPIDRRIDTSTRKGFRFHSDLLLVVIHTDEGLHGTGEANGSPDWSGETQGSAKALIEGRIAPELVGENPLDVTRVMTGLDKIHGNPFAKAAIEMALLDLQGKAWGVPVYRLLGGAVRPLEVPLRFPLFPVDPDQAAEVAAKVASEGCRTVKVKVGRDDMDVDLERVAAVREAVGDDVRVTVDANGGWSVSEAVAIAPGLERLGVAFIEQPTHRADLEALAYVRQRSALPIMADEGVFTMHDALTCLRVGAADVISVYPGKNGSVRNVLAIAAAAEAVGVHCAIGSNMEWDVASAAMAHVTVAAPNIRPDRYGADIIGVNFHVERALATPLDSTTARFVTPDRPGLGVELDMDALESLRT